jgi:hypothetical protein
MKNEVQNDKRKKSHVGEGMALGVALGLIFGLLFLDGDISIGMVLGLCFSLIVGSIIDTHQEQHSG